VIKGDKIYFLGGKKQRLEFCFILIILGKIARFLSYKFKPLRQVRKNGTSLILFQFIFGTRHTQYYLRHMLLIHILC